MRVYGIVLIGLLVLGSLAVYFAGSSGGFLSDPVSEGSFIAANAPRAPKPPSRIIAQPARGFQALVSYTGEAFEPMHVTIARGDTVRFFNDSLRPLWIAAGSAKGDLLYPGFSRRCGASSFDSCGVIEPGSYWEFTFKRTGSWTYKNNAVTSATGVINVQ